MSLRHSLALVAALVVPAAMAQDSPPLTLVDSSGAAVGRLSTSFTNPLGVFYDVDGLALAFIRLRTDANHLKGVGFIFLEADHIYFATPDCSGPAWFSSGGAPGAHPAFVRTTGSGTWLYVADGYEVDASRIHSRSHLNGDLCIAANKWLGSVYKASTAPTDLRRFVPPFAVQ